MCTLTYYPISDTQFVLTTNRDESPTRAQAKDPMISKIHGTNILFPKDPQGGGTWIAASEEGRIACLLNGALKKHTRANNYRLSRGVVLLDSFRHNEIEEFVVKYNFKNIEPFTLIILDLKRNFSLFEIRWDGTQQTFSLKDETKPYIWSSATLYDKQMKSMREAWFREFLKTNSSHKNSSLLQFHKQAGIGNPEIDIYMKRPHVQTVSTTQIENSEDFSLQMRYINYLTEKDITKKIDISKLTVNV